MISRLSNTATLKDIEGFLNIPYQYKSLYKPQIVVNGMEETSVSIVTSTMPTTIQFGIWGILPHCYSQEWNDFQNFENTLTTELAALQPTHWLYESLKTRRCYVIVTGYFIHFLEEKKLKPMFVSKSGENIFCLAGIYNETEDGFITFTLLTKGSNHFQSKTSFSPMVPILLSEEDRAFWTGKNQLKNDYLDFLTGLQQIYLNQHPVNPSIMGKGKKTMQMLEPYKK